MENYLELALAEKERRKRQKESLAKNLSEKNPVTNFVKETGKGFGKGFYNAATGVAELAQNLGNFPANAASYLSGGKINPSKSNVNYEQYFGTENPTGIEKGIREGFKEAPFIIPPMAAEGALGRVLEQGMRGYGSGIVQNENPREKALPEALSQGLLEIPGAFGNLTKIATKFGSRPWTEELTKELSQRLPAEKIEAFNVGKKNYENKKIEENQAWKTVHELANSETNAIPTQIADFFDDMKNLKDKLASNTTMYPVNKKYASTVDSLDEFIKQNESKVTSAGDALELGKALNEMYRNKMGLMGEKPDKKVVQSLINNYKSKMNEFFKENGLTNLKNEWQEANKITATNSKIFNKISTTPGKYRASAFSNLLNKQQSETSPERFVEEYVPKAKEESASRMRQFSQLVGDESLAKATLLDSIFDKAIINKQIMPDKFMSKYTDLSRAQREFLFGKEKTKVLDSLNQIYHKNPPSFETPYFKNAFRELLAAPVTLTKDIVEDFASKPSMRKRILEHENPQKRNPLTDNESLAQALKLGIYSSMKE
jgi:hypothetical protein